jgi:hypothetical protein
MAPVPPKVISAPHKIFTHHRELATTLPFAIPAPAAYKEFRNLADGRSSEELGTIIDRIIILHHPSLAPENADKLKVLASR